jgi:energy-coupling factor transporter ATP-binding protein EcfA2
MFNIKQFAHGVLIFSFFHGSACVSVSSDLGGQASQPKRHLSGSGRGVERPSLEGRASGFKVAPPPIPACGAGAAASAASLPEASATEAPVLDSLSSAIKYTERKIRDKIKEEAEAVSRVLVLGVTGSGKTTLVHALAGKRLVVKEGGARLLLEVPSGQALPGFTIGHTAASATVAPVCWRDRSSALSYWDCPGFFDSRGSGQDIVNAFAVDQLFTAPSRIKSLLVVQESEITDSRGRDVFGRFDKLTKLLPNPEELYRSIVLVVTKTYGEFSPHELLRGIEGSDSPLLRFFVEHPETVFSFPRPLKGSHGSTYSLFEDRDKILAKLRDGPVENPRHSIDLEPHSIAYLLGISKDFGDIREHISSLTNAIQTSYRGSELAGLKVWQRSLGTLLKSKDVNLETPEKVSRQIFTVARIPSVDAINSALDQMSSSWQFIHFLLKIQESGFLIRGMEAPSIPEALRPLLEKLQEELTVLISNAEAVESEKKRSLELKAELDRKKREALIQEQNQKKRMEEVEIKARKDQELLKAKLDEQVRAGAILKKEARRQVERQEQEARAEKARLEQQWREMEVSMERSQRETLSQIESQKRDALERAERAQRSLDSVQADLDRVRREHRDSQSAWESRLEREKAEYRERVMESVRRQLAAQGIGVGFNGSPPMMPFGGGVPFGFPGPFGFR